jgi:hypothetical protein
MAVRMPLAMVFTAGLLLRVRFREPFMDASGLGIDGHGCRRMRRFLVGGSRCRNPPDGGGISGYRPAARKAIDLYGDQIFNAWAVKGRSLASLRAQYGVSVAKLDLILRWPGRRSPLLRNRHGERLPFDSRTARWFVYCRPILIPMFIDYFREKTS